MSLFSYLFVVYFLKFRFSEKSPKKFFSRHSGNLFLPEMVKKGGNFVFLF